jgi:thiol-disulfide isomerase/thioredoxin
LLSAPARPFPRSRTTVRAALVALTAIAIVLLAACGSNGSDDGADSASGVSPGVVASEDGAAVTSTPDSESGDSDAEATSNAAPSFESTGLQQGDGLPQFVGLSDWLNSPALTAEQLVSEGKVVLIDFWTYTCVNCLRTLPFIKDWHDKYAEHGLVILGVHAPEFEFEANPDNVRDAVERQGIVYPVAQDNAMETWRAFFNNVWPAKYLFSGEGELVYRHFGEGDYLETEEQIRAALIAAGADLEGIEPGGVEEPMVDPLITGITRELYGGYERNFTNAGIYAGQEEYYRGIDQEAEYLDEEPHGHQQWFVQGLWRNEAESIQHARATENLEDWLAFRFLARSVNVVMHPGADEAYEVIVEIDGRPLDADEAGADVRFDEQGRSVITVDEPRMYAVVELPELGDRELKLLSNSEHFGMFAVTFGAYTEGA